MKLNQRVALITGASSGVGAATARALASRECHVVITWRKNEEGGRKTAEECRRFGAKVMLLQLDVTDDHACRAVIDRVRSEFGQLDILINNAGMTVFRESKDLNSIRKEDFLDLYTINTIGAFQLTRAALPLLQQGSLAHVVNVASTAGKKGSGSAIAYAASKGALITLTLSLARAAAPVVRVNAVCPGFIHGDWQSRFLEPEKYAARKRRIELSAPLKRVATPETVADAIVSVIEGWDLVTGETLTIDGGSHLNMGVFVRSPRSFAD